VSDVEVLARPLHGDALDLIAYLVPRGEVAVPDLRRHLAAALPDYMVPAAFVLLPALPLTANGKVDRRALPDPVAAPAARGADYVAPRTPTEEKLTALYAAVLRQERVGVNQDFFELGGHSLLATQLIARVRETFGLELPLRHVFETPTAGAFAGVIDARLAENGVIDAAPAIPRAVRRLRATPVAS
jgi:hypothetical protein